MLSPIQLNLILNQEIIERNPQHCHVQKHLELRQHNRYYIHHKSMIVYANLSSLPLDRLMNGQTIKLMRTNLMGSQQITFLYDLIYSYFPYYFKKQTWNEEGIIFNSLFRYIFVLCISRKWKKRKKLYWLLLFKDTETISWTTTNEKKKRFFYSLDGVPLGHQEYAVTRASSTNHFHDHLSIIGSMCTSTSVYMFAWISIFWYNITWNRFQTISHQITFFFSPCFAFFFFC